MTSGSFSFSVRNPIAGLTETTPALSSEGEAKNTYLTNPNAFSLPGFKALKTVDDFVASLDALGVPGPLTLYTTFTLDNRLGEGAQFSVYAGSVLDSSSCEDETILDPVAVKRCMFKVQDNTPLDLTSPKSRRQVHDMYLEIMALQHADLQRHRNIVRFLGWGIEEVWHQTPLLVLELAVADLHSIFEKRSSKMTYSITHQLSIDVGQGLDAIHKAGIIHGDIKAQNVLVFDNFLKDNISDTVPLVAKLADFGLSVGEVQASMNDLVEVSAMSTDWCAPEIKFGDKLSTLQLIKADNFSYGLLVLSVNCLKGQPPVSKDLKTALEIIRSRPDATTSSSSLLETALAPLLKGDASERPLTVGDILKDESEQCILWSVISD
jgi:serine/threonine protein kinase